MFGPFSHEVEQVSWAWPGKHFLLPQAARGMDCSFALRAFVDCRGALGGGEAVKKPACSAISL